MSDKVRKPGFWTKLFAKRDWRLVKQLEQKYLIRCNHTDTVKSDGHVLTYYLFENQFGERKFDLVDSREGDLKVGSLEDDNYAFRCEVYMKQVHGWLKGGYDPEIPNYHSVEHKNFLDTLRGRKEA